MEKERVVTVKFSTLFFFILIVLFIFLSFLLLILNKNDSSAQATEPIQTSSEGFSNTSVEYSNHLPENIVDNKATEQLVEEPIEQSTEEVILDVDEETIRTLFSKYLDTFKTRRDGDSLKITDYSIPTITIYTGDTKTKIVEDDQGQYYKITDTLADVYYDVKPYDINNCSGWFAGKEPIENGNWLRGKCLCVRVRDGVLEIMGTSF